MDSLAVAPQDLHPKNCTRRLEPTFHFALLPWSLTARTPETDLKLAIYFMRMFIFYLGITPPRPEDEKRYALLLLAILATMTGGLILLTRFLLGIVFSANGVH